MTTRLAARLVLFDAEGRLLLFRHDDGHGRQFWATPGGGLEPGETIEQAARREAAEELGAHNVQLVPLWTGQANFVFGDREISQTESFFLVTTSDAILGPEVEDEHRREGITEVGWLSMDGIDMCTEPLFPTDLADRLRAMFFRPGRRVRAPRVRLLDSGGRDLGVVVTREALRLAETQELELVEVDPNADPPVVRMMDFGRFKYEAAKKEKAARRHSAPASTKDITFGYNIDDRDLDVKMRQIRAFLDEGHCCRLFALFEPGAPERAGLLLLDQIVDELQDVATVIDRARAQGQQAVVVLAPLPAPKPG